MWVSRLYPKLPAPDLGYVATPETRYTGVVAGNRASAVPPGKVHVPRYRQDQTALPMTGHQLQHPEAWQDRIALAQRIHRNPVVQQ